jgi:hypothetical protein
MKILESRMPANGHVRFGGGPEEKGGEPHLACGLPNYNQQRPHCGRFCYGKTQIQTFNGSKYLADAKMLDRHGSVSQSNLKLSAKSGKSGNLCA